MAENPVALSQIRADLAEIEADIEEQRKAVEAAQNAMEASQKRANVLRQLVMLAEVAYGDEPTEEAASLALVPPVGKYAGMDAIDAMVAVLTEAGVSLALPEIAKRMVVGGWETKAKVPVDTLRVALRRDTTRQIERVGRGRYTLREVPPWERPRSTQPSFLANEGVS